MNVKVLVFGIVAAVVLAGAGIGGAYWWHQRNLPSQASAADCSLAQDIIDRAQKLPHDKTAVAKWQKDMHDLRTAKMSDGYLGLEISSYEAWSANRATDTGTAPSKDELKSVRKNANSHCTAVKRTLVFPTIAY
ncbi:hypothetical protein ACFWP5_37070 [Streptomyces sp. NPDC058469]|uniref:hypothetical protein n=1 Tax=Streptomyces sp. NPDC058469 TaxID=3346514 RepID=UPI00364BADE0